MVQQSSSRIVHRDRSTNAARYQQARGNLHNLRDQAPVEALPVDEQVIEDTRRIIFELAAFRANLTIIIVYLLTN